MSQVFRCKRVSSGIVEGEALISQDAILFYYTDPATGVVTEDGHCLKGVSVKDKILIFPGGKGSSSVQADGMYRLDRDGSAPRALIVEEEALRAYRLDRVNVVPQPKAGGSFATAAWAAFSHPAAVERIGCAAAGIDIGQTLIGMHLRPVAVPVRLSVRKIGEACISCARTRPKFVGGSRAVYDPALL